MSAHVPGALPMLVALARIPLDPRRLDQLPDVFPRGVRALLLAAVLLAPALVVVLADRRLRRRGRGARRRSG